MIELTLISFSHHYNLFTIRYYFTLCTYKKNTSFYFFNKLFWGVDSKSAIHFFRSALENHDNPEKTIFSGLSRFFGV